MTTSTPSPFDVFAYQRALRGSGLPPAVRLVGFVLSRNFAWTLTSLTGQGPAGRGAARWSADDRPTP